MCRAVLTGWQMAMDWGWNLNINAGVLLTGWVGWGNPEPGLPPPGGWSLSLQWGRVCDCAPFRPPQGGHVLWQHKEMSQQRKAWPLQWHWPLKGLLYCSVNSEREKRKIKSRIIQGQEEVPIKNTQYSQPGLSETLGTLAITAILLFMGSFQIRVWDYCRYSQLLFQANFSLAQQVWPVLFLRWNRQHY